MARRRQLLERLGEWTPPPALGKMPDGDFAHKKVTRAWKAPPGEAYVAAMTLMIYTLWLVGNVFGFVALGSTAMVARFAGAGNPTG